MYDYISDDCNWTEEKIIKSIHFTYVVILAQLTIGSESLHRHHTLYPCVFFTNTFYTYGSRDDFLKIPLVIDVCYMAKPPSQDLKPCPKGHKFNNLGRGLPRHHNRAFSVFFQILMGVKKNFNFFFLHIWPRLRAQGGKAMNLTTTIQINNYNCFTPKIVTIIGSCRFHEVKNVKQ